MNLEAVEKKLREARFFLNKMIEHERMAFHDKEPFDFYLSAFLNAGRTVDYRLRHEQKTIYPTWRIGWDRTLTQAQQGLLKWAIIQTPAYYFTIDGIERKTTKACGEYLALLEQMVAAFKAHPGPLSSIEVRPRTSRPRFQKIAKALALFVR